MSTSGDIPFPQDSGSSSNMVDMLDQDSDMSSSRKFSAS